MVAFAFGIQCNKLRIFHCAIDTYPDFCNVIVKTNAYYTILFIRERRLSMSGYFVPMSPGEY
jgi:hypothetical protein